MLALLSVALVAPIKGAEPDHHLNSLSAFLGITSKGRRQRASTLGLEYKRRLSDRWFITPTIEHAFGDLDFNIVALALGYRFNRWAVYAGPGVEWAQHEDGAKNQERIFISYGGFICA